MDQSVQRFRSKLSDYSNTPDLLEFLFPDAELPLPVHCMTSALVTNYRLFSPLHHRWTKYPLIGLNNTGEELSTFLNSLGRSMLSTCKIHQVPLVELDRVWVARGDDGGLPPPHLPNVALFENTDRISWPAALAHAHMVNFSDALDDESAFSGAEACFTTQCDHRFYLCAQFEHDFVKLFFYDQTRAASSHSINIHEQPELLVRLVAGLMFAPRHVIGMAPSIFADGTLSYCIFTGPTSHQLLRVLSKPKTFPGHGTIVWHAKKEDGTECVVKDTWAELTFKCEISMLLAVQGLPGLPQLDSVEIVETTDYINFSRHIYGVVVFDAPYMFHRRVTMTPYAQSLPFFASKLEFFSVFMDVVNAHKILFTQKRILHRNINISCLMMFHSTSVLSKALLSHSVLKLYPDVRVGLLIGLKDAREVSPHEGGVYDDLYPDTWSHVAIELMARRGALHLVRHDLESFFWVFCSVCIISNGPCDFNFSNPDAPYKKWLLLPEDNDDVYKIAQRKWRMVRTQESFEKTILPYFSPYFSTFKNCASNLRRLLFDGAPDGPSPTHDDVLDILWETFSTSGNI